MSASAYNAGRLEKVLVALLRQDPERPHPLVTHKFYALLFAAAATVALQVGVSAEVVEDTVGALGNIIALLATFGVLHRSDEKTVTPADDPFITPEMEEELLADHPIATKEEL